MANYRVHLPTLIYKYYNHRIISLFVYRKLRSECPLTFVIVLKLLSLFVAVDA